MHLQESKWWYCKHNRHTFQNHGPCDHPDGLSVPFFHGDAYFGDPDLCLCLCLDPCPCPYPDPCLSLGLCHGPCDDPCPCPFLYLCPCPWILTSHHHAEACLPRDKEYR